MNLGIQNRKAIVAGASAGLGYSSAVALANEGVELFISARGKDRLDAAAQKIIKETGACVTPITADHSTREGRAALLAACPEPDIFVITCSPPKMTEDYRKIKEEDWHESAATTLVGPIELMRMTIEGMVAGRWGRIVNIATIAAKHPVEARLLSGPTRSALVNYAVAISKKVARDNVIINNLLPGFHHTPSMDQILSTWAEQNGTTYQQELESLIERLRIPIKRLGNSDDFAAICAMFCSEFINGVVGQNLAVDGGISHGLF